ncbi:LysR family transcriptional regulator [Umezawaea sp. NPDC059074]|uniref:LysR family transcriptional regulator n=1 Tax=Umezawaea sp. NPDC059074 TaxID=3346716 RepID=UPI0036A63F18
MIPVDVRQLECFIAVAEELHIGRAAARLRMTQPPLTRRIARLEREVGARLFLRTATGVELTEAGSVLLERAHRIVQLTDHAVERTRLADAGHQGSLVVGYFGALIFGLIPRVLRSFHDRHPEVELVLERASETVQADAIRDGRMHLGFARRYPAEPELVTRVVAAERLFVAVPTDHPLAAGGPIALPDLVDAPLVLFPVESRPSFADEVTRLFAKAEVPMRVVREAQDVVTAIAYVAATRLCAIVPESATTLEFPDVVYVEVGDIPRVPVCCLHRAGEVPEIVRDLVDHLEFDDRAG